MLAAFSIKAIYDELKNVRDEHVLTGPVTWFGLTPEQLLKPTTCK
jgi:hypothetical protein